MYQSLPPQPCHFYINKMKATGVEFATLTSSSPSLLMKSFSSPGTEASPSFPDLWQTVSWGHLSLLSLLTFWSFLHSSSCHFPIIFPFSHLYFLNETKTCSLSPNKNSGSITKGQGQGAPFSVIYLVPIYNIS